MRQSFLNKKFRYSYVSVCLVIAILNVLVFILTHYLNISLYGRPLAYFLGFSWNGFSRGYYWQIFTYMFVHSDMFHLFFNMLALINFGILLEKSIGSKEFLLFYFICGILSGAISTIIYHYTNISVTLIGASGAVYALLFLCSVLYPYTVIYLYFILPLRMTVAVLLFLIIELVSSFFVDGVAHLTHLSGLVIAFIYCLVRLNISPLKVYKSALSRRR